jgi:tetratricopeptide (TPR) repeat protein
MPTAADEEVASLERALALHPDDPEALYRLGNAHLGQGRHAPALACFERALQLDPHHVEALCHRGNALLQLGRFGLALASYDRALALRPDDPVMLSNRGLALHALGRFEQALASYDRALAAGPRDPGTLVNRGITLYRLERFEAALASFDRALALSPNDASALSQRGAALRALERPAEALASIDRALTLRPHDAGAHSNRGSVLGRLGRLDEAQASFDRALALRPNDAGTFYNRGNVLRELGRHGAAQASYEQALALRPAYAEARYNRALGRLLAGDFEAGWADHEARWDTAEYRHARRAFTQPLWTGEDELGGRTVLLHAEQGFGDTIQFCRYAPLVAARGACVVLEVAPPLQRLAQTLAGVAATVPRGAALPEFDRHCPLLTLPRAFATRLDSIPSATPYLASPPRAVADWHGRLGPWRRPRIGLAWSGRANHRNDHNRSMALADLRPLFEIEATFVSLQPQVRPGDEATIAGCGNLLDVRAALRDFADTAALIGALDLVVSVDTAAAHLAGALARPVWVLLPFAPDWRWLLERSDSPWYPTARLFRQDRPGDWSGVVRQVRAALDSFVARDR